jgi:sodium transport system ATP-binding protein
MRVIEVKGVQKRYGAITAVAGVSFRAEQGRITGLLGPNGAGKTTTLRVISSLIKPDAGTAIVDGFDVRKQTVEAQSRLGILPDSRGLYPRLTTREHWRYFGRLQGLTSDVIDGRSRQLADLLEMAPLMDRRVEGFSQGERTKVAIGRILVHEPGNLILDEATNGLDVMSTRALRVVIRRLAEAGTTVLFSTHIMQEVAALCDHIVVFARGSIVAEGTSDELRQAAAESNLEDAFVKLIGSGEGLVA